MEDTELRELFHGLIVRMERFEVRMDALEKAFTDFRSEARGRLDAVDRRMESLENRLSARMEGLDNRLKDKADWRVISLYTALLVVVMTVYKFFV